MHPLNETAKKIIYPLLLLAIIFILWQVAVLFLNIPPTVLPSPLSVFRALFKNFGSLILPELLFTFKNLITGYLIAIVLGFGLAAICSRSKILVRAVSPVAVMFLLTPMLVFIPIFMVLFGFSPIVRILVVILQTSPIILLNTMTGFTGIAPEQKELFAAHGCSKWQIFYKYTLFASMPQIFTGLKLGSIIATIAALGSDITMGKSGLGHRIKMSSAMVKVDMVFATIIVAALVGIIMFEAVSLIEKKVVVWKR
jgi:NitT/TauT family transport system permease protein